MTNTTELRKNFKNSVLALYEMEGKSLDPTLLNLIANNFDHFCSIGIEQAERAKEEQFKEDYIAWVFHNSYGERRQYEGKTPFAEWKLQAEVRDMSDWK